MKTLYLIRHAKSNWDNPYLRDIERPLNARGNRDAPVMGKRLANNNTMPGLLLSSPAERALTTCKIIAQEIGYPAKDIRQDAQLYHATAEELLSVVKRLQDIHNRVWLFGHNPGLTDFANTLTHASIENIPTCGVVACTFDVTHWKEIAPETGTLVFFDFPKNKI